MVAAATARARLAGTSPNPGIRTARRSAGTWVIVGIPVLLVLTLVWQLASGLFHSEMAVREAVAVGRVSLEADPLGSRIDFVVVDRVGQETTFNGNLNVRLREPDGSVWRTTRALSASDFRPLPDGSLLAGRQGYSIVVPAADWVRAPRRGGTASVSLELESSEGSPFSVVADERFP